MTDSTGPKISSCATSMSGVTPSRIVGPTKAPSGFAPGVRPSTASVAPPSTPFSIHAADAVARGASRRPGRPGCPSPCRRRPCSAFDLRDQRVEQRPLGVADRDHDRARHAALAGRAERGADDVVGRLVHHARRASRPCGSSRRRAPARACRSRPSGGRCSAAVLAEPTKEIASMSGESSIALTTSTDAVHEVDHAGRQPADLVHDLPHQGLRHRHLLGRLQDVRVAAGDRRTAGTRTAPSPGS